MEPIPDHPCPGWSLEMKAISSRARRLPPPPAPWSWLLLAGITVGSLDLVFAWGFWSLRDGATLVSIPQSIAAWVLGRDAALAGGATTAVLGAALYCYLTTAMVAGYHLLGERHRVLLRRPLLAGALYGIAMYALLFEVAVPLWSAAGPRAAPLEWRLACVLAYAVLIGIPRRAVRAALASRRTTLTAMPRGRGSKGIPMRRAIVRTA